MPPLSVSEISSLLASLRSTTTLAEAASLALSIASSHTLSLLNLIQAIPRDPSNDFAPLPRPPPPPSSSPAVDDPIDLSDSALLLLNELATINESLLEDAGWENVGPGSVCGSCTYRNDSTGDVAESPDLPATAGSVLGRVSTLMSPGVLDGEVVWAVKVAFVNEGAAVLDVLKFEDGDDDDDDDDDDGGHAEGGAPSTPSYCVMRGIYHLPWRGLDDVPVDEVVLSDRGRAAGGASSGGGDRSRRSRRKRDAKQTDLYSPDPSPTPALESWAHTTLCGLALCSSKKDPHILIFGLGVGSVARFISFYRVGARVTVVEPSRALADAFLLTVNASHPLPPSCAILDENLEPYPNQQVAKAGLAPPPPFPPPSAADVVLVDCGAVPPSIFQSGFGPAGDLIRALILPAAPASAPTLVVAAVSESAGAKLRDDNGGLRTFREHELRGDDASAEERQTKGDDDELAITRVAVLVDRARVATDLTVSSWHAASGAVSTGAMDVAKAQKTSVVSFPSLLSADDIASIKAASSKAVELGAGLEVRSGSVPGDPWSVVHLNTAGIFDRLLPGLRERLVAVARSADEREGWGLLPPRGRDGDDVRIRVAEFHDYKGPTAGLPDPRHYDQDSLITVDCMIGRPDVDFEGGVLRTLETDGTMREHEFREGDAVAFVSHKYHSVTPVVKGVRNVLVVEFWKGKERQCGHRCLLFEGRCPRAGCDSLEVEKKGGDSGGGAEAAVALELPFRLGSVAESAEKSGEWLLLWEPAGTVEKERGAELSTKKKEDHKTSAPQIKLGEHDESWQLFD